VLFSEPKIPQLVRSILQNARFVKVSVLFSEPKIPQSTGGRCWSGCSAVSVLFSEPKIPQSCARAGRARSTRRFSALQRAENSSIVFAGRADIEDYGFQCSSASRKFLNAHLPPDAPLDRHGFSALQRAENSSMKFGSAADCSHRCRFSALQRAENSSIQNSRERYSTRIWVSVLFSEPKIPQFLVCPGASREGSSFSALQRAENSSIRNRVTVQV